MASPQRRPYHGSCHCGHTKYIVYLTIPPAPVQLNESPSAGKGLTRFYRCNCSTCHKAGIFHTRPAHPPSDFLLLSPLDPGTGLGDYTCFSSQIHFYFCPECGNRCFSFAGEGGIVERDLDAVLGSQGKSEGEKKTSVWMVKDDRDARGGKGPYLSINAHTIEVDQGLEMRKLTEDKVVQYIDCRESVGDLRYDFPHAGGSF